MAEVTVVAFSGDLTIDRYPEIHAAFDAFPRTARRVLIDLGEVQYVDSTFLTELLLFVRRFADRGAGMALIATANVARILNLTGIDLRIAIASTREAAVTMLIAANPDDGMAI